jgi:hypothetical protein
VHKLLFSISTTLFLDSLERSMTFVGITIDIPDPEGAVPTVKD